MRSIIKGKKGFAQLVPLILAIGVAIVILGVMASVAANTRTGLSDVTIGTNTSHVYTESCIEDCGTTGNCNWTCEGAVFNVTNAGLGALVTVSGYWGIIVTIGVFIIILGALMTMFKGGKRR